MPHEIFDSNGNYVGYMTSDGHIVDTRRGGLGGATQMASAKLAQRNIAERTRIQQERRNGR